MPLLIPPPPPATLPVRLKLPPWRRVLPALRHRSARVPWRRVDTSRLLAPWRRADTSRLLTPWRRVNASSMLMPWRRADAPRLLAPWRRVDASRLPLLMRRSATRLSGTPALQRRFALPLAVQRRRPSPSTVPQRPTAGVEATGPAAAAQLPPPVSNELVRMPTASPEAPRPSLRRQRSPAAPGSSRLRRLQPSGDVSHARVRAPGSIEHLGWLTPEAWDVPRVERSFNPFPATVIRRALRPCADRPSIARASSVGCPRDLRALKPPCHTQDARC